MPELKAADVSGDGLRIWRNARLATLRRDMPGLGIIERGAVAVHGGRIVFAGAEADLPGELGDGEIVDCGGRLVTPGLIDCHTHLIHAGSRANEWQMRLAGASYEDVARAGGGIVSSVKALRAADEDALVAQALPRLDALIAEGVTTVEVKSGYGLDTANELKSLRAARRLEAERAVTVRTTCLAAHALPPEAEGDKDRFIAAVVDDVLPAAAQEGLADAVDAFCEGIAFSSAQVERVFRRAQALGLPVKLHADQLSNGGGAVLAARYSALSADHLEYADEHGVRAMGEAGTVAVMLPGAFYFIRETTKPPVAFFRRHGVAMAVATDCNPGTSPLTSLLLAANMAATLFGMTVEECVAGITREAARALGMENGAGTLEPGKRADMAIWNADEPVDLICRLGFNPLYRRVWSGR